MTFPGDYTLRCRACEAQLDRPVAVEPSKYGVTPNKHGAVIRQCKACKQLWLGYVQQLPNLNIKVCMKMVDKLS